MKRLRRLVARFVRELLGRRLTISYLSLISCSSFSHTYASKRNPATDHPTALRPLSLTSQSVQTSIAYPSFPHDPSTDMATVDELAVKYSSQLPQLQVIFPSWDEGDLAFALQDARGNVDEAAMMITEGAHGSL